MRIDQTSKFLLLLVVLVLFPVTAQTKLPPGTPLQRVPDALIDPGSGIEGYALVVEKATQ
ncbi:MAG: hypothetical protein JRI34_14025, partial [Deltaproteobacteria bacterium]|nr:hypothetical protein [Deltaproteobacteria bacterium]